MSLSVLRLALALAAIPVLTHRLGLTRYGVWAVLISVLSFTAVLQVGLAPAISFHVAQARRDPRGFAEILATSLFLLAGLGLVAAGLLMLGARLLISPLFGALDGAGEARTALPLLGVAAFLQFVKQWAASVEAGLLRYDLQARAEGVGTVALYGGLVILAVLGHGLVVLAGWWVVATCVALLVHWHVLRTRLAPVEQAHARWSAATAIRLLRYGSKQWASQLGGTVFSQVDRVVVTLSLGPAAAGLYTVATSVAVRINELSAAPVQVIVPALAEAESVPRQVQIYQRAERVNMLVAYGLAATVMVAAQPLARFLVPAEGESMTALLRVMAVGYGAYSINAVGFFGAQGLGAPAINARWVLVAGLLFLLVLSTMVGPFGLLGAAWANLTYSLTLGINWAVKRRLGLAARSFLTRYARFAVALALCFIATTYPHTLMPLPVVRPSLGVAAVAAGAWLIRGQPRPRPEPATHGREVRSRRGD